eukprot:s1186_g10.t1
MFFHFASRHARLAAQVTPGARRRSPRVARLAPVATLCWFPQTFAQRRGWRNAMGAVAAVLSPRIFLEGSPKAMKAKDWDRNRFGRWCTKMGDTVGGRNPAPAACYW